MPDANPPLDDADLRKVGIHHDFIKTSVKYLPPYLIEHLNNSPFSLPQWFTHATPQQRHDLKHTQQLNDQSFSAVSTYLEQISTVESFAAPLLEHALKATFGITCDVKKNVITITTLNRFTQEVESSTTQTLLQAALHNFNAAQAEPGGIPRRSNLWDYQSLRPSDPPAKRLEIEPVAFARLCRDLDIGGQYQTHLNTLFNPSDVAIKTTLDQAFVQHERHVLMLQAQSALMKGDITERTHATLISYCRGQHNPLFNDLPMTCNSLALDDIPFTSMILAHGSPLEQGQRCIVYIPGDPVSCLKEYPSVRDAAADLEEKLQDKNYRNFFIHLAPQYQKLKLTKRLNRRFVDASRDPLEMQFNPVASNLFEYLYAQKKQQLLRDAYFLAVPTAAINRVSLIDRIEHYFDTALNVLNVAALFVPGVGELMAVVFAAQVMTDIYHGIEAWEQDEKALAWAYTRSVLINAALVAAAGKLASEVVKPVPIEISPFVEELDVITLAQGKTQLWKPDLKPYEHEISFDSSIKADKHGLYRHEEKNYLKLEGKHYQVETAADGSYRLQHPTTPQAYTPVIRTNGQGAWVHEVEELEQWNDPTFVRRLDPSVHDLSDQQALDMFHASNTDAGQLRQSFIDQQPPPALLEDCIKRFDANQTLDHFIAQMRTGNVAADPLLQLQVLVEADTWPRTKALRCIDNLGNTIVEYGNTTSLKLPVIQILDSQVRQGHLLKTVLQSLDTAETRFLIGPDPVTGSVVYDLDAQVQQLSTRIAEHAERLREGLFTSLYELTQRSRNPLVKQLADVFPELPVAAANEMISAATSTEIRQLQDGVRVPLRLQEEARTFAQEARLMRAYDSYFFGYQSTPDTQKLILHSLEQMPGWPADLRLEVRERTLAGRLLDHVGPTDAPIRKVLVNEGNRYTTYNGHEQMLHGLDDIYASVLHALPDEQRAALGFPHTGQGQALKEALAERAPMARQTLRKVLGLQPTTLKAESPLQRAKGRAGYPALDIQPARCGRAPFACMPANPRRIRHLKSKLFPMHTYEVVEDFLELQSLYSRAGLARLEALNKEYKVLKDTLVDWINGPLEMVQISESHIRPVHIRDKTRAANKIIRCWQRSSGLGGEHPGTILNISDMDLARLPPINADFSHVTSLQMNDMYLHHSIDPFLAQFPNLQELKFESAHLKELPPSLFNLQALKQLHLSNNRITLTAEAADKLATLKDLRVLNLSNNPLGVIPGFTQMSELARLNLKNTGLTQWPAGIEQLERLMHLDLRDNNLTTVPEGYFQIPAQRLRNTFLHDNPLDNSTFAAVNAYRTRLGLALENRVHVPEPVNRANLWLDLNLDEPERALRSELWAALEAEPHAENFFRIIRDLVASADFERARPLLTERVWKVLETTAEDAGYREEVFANSQENETCVDRTSTIFSRFGFKLLLREALLAEGSVKESKLLTLMKGRVRLLELDDIAQTQIALQTHAYESAVSEGVLSPPEIQRLKPDELEVKLVYQVDLAQRLDLPWQPSHMLFRDMAKISPAQIEEAYQIVLNQEAVPGYMAKKLLEESIWRDFIETAYSDDIRTSNAFVEQRHHDLEALQEKQQQWVDTTGSNDTAARRLLQSDLKQLAQRLVIDEARVFGGAPMPDTDYYAELEKMDQQKKKTLERITQRILDKKPLETIIEE